MYWGKSRQAWYKQSKQSTLREEQEAVIIDQVREMRREQTKLGTRKLYKELRGKVRCLGNGVGRDKLFDIMKRHDLLVKRRRKYAVTTNSDHPYYRYGNELEKAEIKAANKAWVSDITYLRTRKGFVYLSLITDRYSRKIIGWNVDQSLGVEGTLKSLQMAINQCKNTKDVIHHSDRGIQYCCYAYTNKLKKNGIRISMGATGNCYENAIAERVNGILKDEYLLDSEFIDIKQAIEATRQAIYLYNYKRPHWSLKLKKPAEVHDAYTLKSAI